jgi:hypothetical protein
MDGTALFPARLAARLLSAGLALVAILAGAGTALADDQPTAPAARWPAGGTALRTAMGLAAERWGVSPCRGRITVAWGRLDREINATSSWSNDLDPYLQPSRNGDCEVTLSTAAEWDWPKLCSVVLHELGHLAGHDHVGEPDDVMYFIYLRPEPECAATPEPAPGPPARPTAAPPKSGLHAAHKAQRLKRAAKAPSGRRRAAGRRP